MLSSKPQRKRLFNKSQTQRSSTKNITGHTKKEKVKHKNTLEQLT